MNGARNDAPDPDRHPHPTLERHTILDILGWIVGIALFCCVAPILAFCVIPIPAFLGGVIHWLYRAARGAP